MGRRIEQRGEQEGKVAEQSKQEKRDRKNRNREIRKLEIEGGI
jgi:hypothetical protein